MKYQKQAKIIAWIDIICSSAFLFLFLLGSVVILTEPELVLKDVAEHQNEEGNTEHEINPEINRVMMGSVWSKLMLLTPTFAYLLAEIILGLYLLRAAEVMDYKKLRTWFIVTLTMLAILSVFFIPALLMPGRPNYGNGGVTCIFLASNVLFTIYSLWVVRNLRIEIKNTETGQYSTYPPPPVYEASFSNANYYPNANTDKEFLKI